MKFDFKRFINKNGGVILSICASVGVVVTAVLAAKGGKKASEAIETAEQEKTEPLTKLETIKVVAKPYLPATVAGAATIASIVGNAVLGKKQQASLIAAYMAMHESYQKYKHKVKEELGEEAHEKVLKAIAAEKAEPMVITAPGLAYSTSLDVDIDEEKRLFYDCYSDKCFETTYGKVLQAQYHLNRCMLCRGGDFVPLSWWYHFLGVKDPIPNSDEIGWMPNTSYMWIAFNNRLVEMEDGLKCIFIDFPFDPDTEENLMSNYYYA